MKTIEEQILFDALRTAEKSVRLACDQMILLYDRLEGLKKRYNVSINTNQRSMRYPLRMRIVTVEGFINLYYEYTRAKQLEINDLRKKLYHEDTDSSDEFESDYSDGEE